MAIRDVSEETQKAGKTTGKRPGTKRAGGGGDSPPAPSPSARTKTGRKDKLDKVEEKLTETLSLIGVAQTGFGEMAGDPRHTTGGMVTADFAPRLAGAWVKLARENTKVADILIKFAEGSAIGEVTMVTLMFAFTQAQIYGLVPPLPIPNPYLPGGVPPVPPSEEVRQHAAAPVDRDAVIVTPPPQSGPETGRGTPPAGNAAPGSDDAKATEEAERQRKIVEEQRRRRARGSE